MNIKISGFLLNDLVSIKESGGSDLIWNGTWNSLGTYLI